MAITFGDTGAPSQITTNFDAVFSQSLPAIKARLADNIGRSNAFLKRLMDSDLYESELGGTYWGEDLLYELAPMESYDGADELSITNTDGVTQAIYEWRQLASPVMYTGKELKQNNRKLLSFVKTKIMQLEMGIREGFATHFMQGAGPLGGNLHTPRTNPTNGSLSINPLPLLVKFDPTTTTVGNIDPAVRTWWRNVTKTSALSGSSATEAFLAEFQNIFNSCNITGDTVDVVLADQVTFELTAMALHDKYRQTQSDSTFNFTNLRLPFGNGKSLIVMDDKVPDVYSGLTNTTTYGTMYFLNSSYFKLKYIEGTDFEMLKNEAGNAFVKPVNQDIRVGHCAWMGQAGVNNRRKHGVWGKIPRTLAF